MIPFNKPYLSGKETHYIYEAVHKEGHISGNGRFTKKCQQFFEKTSGFKKCLLTTSCTDALEMTALLLDIKPGDEVIVPSFTFVSSALAYVRQGAKIVFVDSRGDHPGMDENKIEPLITAKTKAIVVVHYAGVSCDMDVVMNIAQKHNLYVVEDAAQAIDSYYKGKPLGSIGHFGCFSFHETKNVQCGEGGLLAINDSRFENRAEIIWEKGTDRAQFFRGEIDKYGWVDTGSSFLPSDILAAFLYAQLESIEDIQTKRKHIYSLYYQGLKGLSKKYFQIPFVPEYATINGHMFSIILPNTETRNRLIKHLKSHSIHSVFHYQNLEQSHFIGQETALTNSKKYADTLLRLPLFYELEDQKIEYIIDTIKVFFSS